MRECERWSITALGRIVTTEKLILPKMKLNDRGSEPGHGYMPHPRHAIRFRAPATSDGDIHAITDMLGGRVRFLGLGEIRVADLEILQQLSYSRILIPGTLICGLRLVKLS